ncbi:hypothetical protein FOXYSP1_12572 [Fusarium oxysporum f. sp. phaseoli]
MVGCSVGLVFFLAVFHASMFPPRRAPLCLVHGVFHFTYSVLESCSTVRLPKEGVSECHGGMRAFLGCFTRAYLEWR